jgi:hypothetical protein
MGKSPNHYFLQFHIFSNLTCKNHNGCSVTVDGTYFIIYEPTNFSKKWFSHKFNGPGIRYEVAILIKGGQIVHIQGLYPAGKWPDIKIFRECLKYKLLEGEKAAADNLCVLFWPGEKTKVYHLCTP